MIQREVVLRFLFEVAQHLLIVALNPARRRHVDRFKLALDVVLLAQAMRDHVELQRPDRAENQIVVAVAVPSSPLIMM